MQSEYLTLLILKIIKLVLLEIPAQKHQIREKTVSQKNLRNWLVIGDSMIKDVNGYLLTGSLNRKYILKVRPFSSAKTSDMEYYIIPTKRDLI